MTPFTSTVVLVWVFVDCTNSSYIGIWVPSVSLLQQICWWSPVTPMFTGNKSRSAIYPGSTVLGGDCLTARLSFVVGFALVSCC